MALPDKVHEAVVLSGHPLSDSDIAKVNTLVTELLEQRERIDDRSLTSPSSVDAYVTATFATGRTFDLDLRHHVLKERYS